MSEQTPRDDGEIFTLVDEAGNEELYKEAMRFQSPETGKWYICLYPLDEENDEVVFDFVGNGFLYNQVRIMVAFLLEIGNGRRPGDDVMRVMKAKNRDLARGTAPASGLYLVEVTYDSPVN